MIQISSVIGKYPAIPAAVPIVETGTTIETENRQPQGSAAPPPITNLDAKKLQNKPSPPVSPELAGITETTDADQTTPDAAPSFATRVSRDMQKMIQELERISSAVTKLAKRVECIEDTQQKLVHRVHSTQMTQEQVKQSTENLYIWARSLEGRIHCTESHQTEIREKLTEAGVMNCSCTACQAQKEPSAPAPSPAPSVKLEPSNI